MIRTNTVQLTTIPAVGFRHKLTSGGSGITILRPDVKQPGIASISNFTGEPIPAVNTDTKLYPPEAFREVMSLTFGMPYRKQKNLKVTEDMIIKPSEEKEEELPEEIIVSSEDYGKIIDKYTDKDGHLSYDLLNKDCIRFLKSSTVVSEMIGKHAKAEKIRRYIAANRYRTVTGNEELSDAEADKITELLDEVSPKGVFKELNSEIRKALGAAKKAE